MYKDASSSRGGVGSQSVAGRTSVEPSIDVPLCPQAAEEVHRPGNAGTDQSQEGQEAARMDYEVGLHSFLGLHRALQHHSR